jgi:hypothetical protein
MGDNSSPVEDNREEEKTHFAYENDHDLKEDNFKETNEEGTLEEDNEEQKTQLAYEDDYDSRISWGIMEDNLNELDTLDTENPLQDNFEENGDKEEEPESVLETNIEEVSNVSCSHDSNQSLSNPFGVITNEEELEIVTVPTVVADTDDDINPFDEDDEEEAETITIPAIADDDINPFEEEEEEVQNLVTATDCDINMNPFGDDDTGDEEIHVTKTIMKQSEQQLPRIIKKATKSVSFNPFDDGGTEDEKTIEKAEVINQPKVKESSSASIASIMNKTRNKTQSIMKPDSSVNMFSVEFDKLVLLGFDKVHT